MLASVHAYVCLTVRVGAIASANKPGRTKLSPVQSQRACDIAASARRTNERGACEAKKPCEASAYFRIRVFTQLMSLRGPRRLTVCSHTHTHTPRRHTSMRFPVEYYTMSANLNPNPDRRRSRPTDRPTVVIRKPPSNHPFIHPSSSSSSSSLIQSIQYELGNQRATGVLSSTTSSSCRVV